MIERTVEIEAQMGGTRNPPRPPQGNRSAPNHHHLLDVRIAELRR